MHLSRSLRTRKLVNPGDVSDNSAKLLMGKIGVDGQAGGAEDGNSIDKFYEIFAMTIETTSAIPHMPKEPSLLIAATRGMKTCVAIAARKAGHDDLPQEYALAIAMIGRDAIPLHQLGDMTNQTNPWFLVKRLRTSGLAHVAFRDKSRRNKLITLTDAGLKLCIAVRLALGEHFQANSFSPSRTRARKSPAPEAR